MRIGIKPNLVAPMEAYWGGTTHPEVVAGIVEYLQEKGFSNLVIMEGSWVGDKTSESYEICGFKSLCEKYNVPFLDMQKDVYKRQTVHRLKHCPRRNSRKRSAR